MNQARTQGNRSARSEAPSFPQQSALSLRARVLLGYLLLLMVFGGVLWAALQEMTQTQTSLALLSAGYLPLAREVGGAEATPLGLELEPNQAPAVLYESRRTEARFIELKEVQLRRARDVAEAMARAEQTPQDTAVVESIARSITDVVKHLDKYRDVHLEFLAAFEDAEGRPESLIPNLVGLRSQVEVSLRNLDSRVARRVARVVERTNRAQADARLAVMALSAVAFGIGLLVLVSTSFILRPIRLLISGAERIREGHYDERVSIRSGDEVGRLARSFNSMAAALQERENSLGLRSAELEAALADLRASQEALIRSERLATIGQMAAQIAHEIRNPLNALGLNADMLAEEVKTGVVEEAQETLDAIQNEIRRLTEITESYLALGRLPPLRMDPYPLSTLVGELVRFQKEEMDQAGVDVELNIPSSLPEVLIDSGQLRQALLNILRNATEALDAAGGGHLVLTGGLDQDQIRLDIQDNGPGMDAEQVARIFDPFFSTKETGSGLGLPITQQVISEHGGRIACTSGRGQGTTFSIWLPIAREEAEERS